MLFLETLKSLKARSYFLQLNYLRSLIYISAFPQGTMPVLEIDGKVQISQSTTIARYLTREFSKLKRMDIDDLT